jgi:hypothetical protein
MLIALSVIADDRKLRHLRSLLSRPHKRIPATVRPYIPLLDLTILELSGASEKTRTTSRTAVRPATAVMQDACFTSGTTRSVRFMSFRTRATPSHVLRRAVAREDRHSCPRLVMVRHTVLVSARRLVSVDELGPTRSLSKGTRNLPSLYIFYDVIFNKSAFFLLMSLKKFCIIARSMRLNSHQCSCEESVVPTYTSLSCSRAQGQRPNGRMEHVARSG